MTPPPIITNQPATLPPKRINSLTKGKAVEGRKRIYHLETSEDIGSRNVSVKDEQGKLIWLKTRKLVGDEIVETIYDSNRHARWTIHRPIKGWYIALRSCATPSTITSTSSPSPFIEFKPFTSNSTSTSSESKTTSTFTFTIDSALQFPLLPEGDTIPRPHSPNVRLNFDEIEIGEEEKEEEEEEKKIDLEGTRHTDLLDVPTTPLTVTDSTFPSIQSENSLQGSLVRSKFMLQPVSTLNPPHNATSSTKSGWGWHSIKNLLAGKGKDFTCNWIDQSMVEIVRFEEHTTILTVSTKGTIYLDENLIDVIGMDPTFWITSTLAYLEFLEDGEAYAAASQD